MVEGGQGHPFLTFGGESVEPPLLAAGWMEIRIPGLLATGRPGIVCCQEEVLSSGSGPLTIAVQAQCPLPLLPSLENTHGHCTGTDHDKLHLLRKALPVSELLPWLGECTMS